MRKVVDSNYLRNPSLRAYLAASRNNVVVLTDYAAMDAYKGNTLVSIQNSMAILAEFPTQVLVLKNTVVACGIKGKAAGLQRRFIDEAQTRGFYFDDLLFGDEKAHRIYDQARLLLSRVFGCQIRGPSA